MARQKEGLCIFILFSLVAISVSRPSIVKDYSPYISSTHPQFEKREDGKYYVKGQNLDYQNSKLEYVIPVVNETKVIDNQNNARDAQLTTQVALEKHSILLNTSSSAELIEDKSDSNKEVISSTQGSAIDLEHSKKDKDVSSNSPLNNFSEKNEERATADRFQKAKEREENLNYRVGEEKLLDGNHEAGGAVSEKKLENDISITVAPNEKNAVAQNETPTDDKIIVFNDARDFPSVPMMMSVLPFLLPLAYPSRSNLPLLPLPPALQISDRLPIQDDQATKNIEVPREFVPDDKTNKVAQDIVSMILQRMAGNPFFPPTSLPPSFTPKTADDSEKYERDEKEVNVMGKKFLMKSQMQEQPINGMGKFFIRFMSLRPLESEIPPQTFKNLEKERATEIKYRQPIEQNPDETNVKKVYDSGPHKGTPESNPHTRDITPEVAASKAFVENEFRELKTVSPATEKRKLSDDLTTLKTDELDTKESKTSKIETLATSYNPEKHSSLNLTLPVDLTKKNISQIEGRADGGNYGLPSLAKLTQGVSYESPNQKTGLETDSTSIEGDAFETRSSEVQDTGKGKIALNISDKNEVLETKEFTVGHDQEILSTNHTVKLKVDEADASTETPKQKDTDAKNEWQSEEVKEVDEMKKEKLFIIPEKKKEDFDSR